MTLVVPGTSAAEQEPAVYWFEYVYYHAYCFVDRSGKTNDGNSVIRKGASLERSLHSHDDHEMPINQPVLKWTIEHTTVFELTPFCGPNKFDRHEENSPDLSKVFWCGVASLAK